VSQATTTELSEHPSIHCLLELHYDGTVSVAAKRGCSDEEIRDLLNQLAGGMWLGESADGATARSKDAAA